MGALEEPDASGTTTSSRFAFIAMHFQTVAFFFFLVEINGEKYPQSNSLARHFARQYKLTGKSELDATKCDIIVDTMQEINEAYFTAWFIIEDVKQKQDAQAKFKAETLPTKLQGLEKLMKCYGDGTWAVGNSLTWADLLLHTSIENLLPLYPELLTTFATIKKNRDAVEKSPKIAEYLKNRQQTPF
jgi:glutathione S-transferase